METLTVGELKKFIDSLPDDYKVYLSSDEEGNNFGATSMKFGSEVYQEDKAVILYPHGNIAINDIAPKYMEN